MSRTIQAYQYDFGSAGDRARLLEQGLLRIGARFESSARGLCAATCRCLSRGP